MTMRQIWIQKRCIYSWGVNQKSSELVLPLFPFSLSFSLISLKTFAVSENLNFFINPLYQNRALAIPGIGVIGVMNSCFTHRPASESNLVENISSNQLAGRYLLKNPKFMIMGRRQKPIVAILQKRWLNPKSSVITFVFSEFSSIS